MDNKPRKRRMRNTKHSGPLEVSGTSVLKRIPTISKNIQKPVYKSKTRLIWLVYELRNDTKEVSDFAIGSRTIKTLQKVIDTVLLSNPEKIHIDKLNLYKSIIPARLHMSS